MKKSNTSRTTADRSQVRELSAATGAVDHLGLGRAAGNHEGPGQAGPDVGQTHGIQISVLIEALVVFCGEGTRGCGTLGEDDHEHGEGDGREPPDEIQAPVDLGQGEMRQAAGHGAEHMHGAAEVERPARGDGANHGKQRPRDTLRDLPCADDHHQHGKRHPQGLVVDLVDLLDVEPDLLQGAMPAALEPQHARDLSQRHLYANARQKPNQHRARQEVGQECKADDPCQDKENAGHDGQHAGERQVFIGPGIRQPDETGGENGRSGRVGADHQVPR